MDADHKKEDKAARLAQIARDVSNLTDSPLVPIRQAYSYQPVVGAGNPDADLLFIGEAPGKQEAESGMPFVGKAGRVLDDLLRSINVDRESATCTHGPRIGSTCARAHAAGL